MNTVGLVFLILFIALMLYFLLGSLVRFNRGLRSCPMMLPHYQIWCRLLFVVVYMLTCGKVRLFRTIFGPGADHYSYGGAGYAGAVVLPNPPHSSTDHRFATVMQEEELDDFDMDAALKPAEIVVVY